MDNYSLIEILQYERNKLTTILSSVFNKDSTAQITSKMNVKEVLGHITWYENQVLLTLKTGKKLENPFNHLSTDEKNNQISLIYKNFTFDQVKKQSNETFNQIIKSLEQVTNEQLNDEKVLSDTNDTRKPWQMLIENSFIHYEEHIVGLKHWLKSHDLE